MVSAAAALLTATSHLATTHMHLGQHGDALELQQEMLALQTRVLPPDHPDIATSRSNLAAAHMHLGRYGDALVQANDQASRASVLASQLFAFIPKDQVSSFV